MLPPAPDDPGAAAALANRRSVKRLERARLLRWAADTLGVLGIEAVPPVETEVLLDTEEEADRRHPNATTGRDAAADMHQPNQSLDRPTPGGQLAGAASVTTREAV